MGLASLIGAELPGAQIRVARPGASSDRLLFAHIVTTTGSPVDTLVIDDPSQEIYNALQNNAGFTVLPFYEDYWGGGGLGASYSAMTDLTTFTGSFGTPLAGLGDTVHVGDVIVPDLNAPAAYFIESVTINDPGTDSLTVRGDVSAGDWFRIHQASQYKYDFSDELKSNACDYGGRYLFSGYRRMPQTGARAGEDPYHCWNRWYLPSIGRWTSPDPAMSPWSNLWDYCDGNPVGRRDSSALESVVIPNKGTFTLSTKSTANGLTLLAPGAFGGVGVGVQYAKYHFVLDFLADPSCPCSDTIGIVQILDIKYDGKIYTARHRGRWDNESIHPEPQFGGAIDTNVAGNPYGGTMGTQKKASAQIDDEPQQNNLKDGLIFGDDIASKVEYHFWDCAICATDKKFYGCVDFTITFSSFPVGAVDWLTTAQLSKPLRDTQEQAEYWNNYPAVAEWNKAEAWQLPVNLQ